MLKKTAKMDKPARSITARKVMPTAKATTLSPAAAAPSISISMMKPAYPSPLPISQAKKNDLLKLCDNGAIQSKFHDFYSNLPTSTMVRDTLPEPDCTEHSEKHG